MSDATGHPAQRQWWPLILAASAILLITMGARQTSGLFLIPITQSTGVTVVAMSFALAVGQFVFGAAQPVFGAIADKFGAVKVVVAGAIMLALGCVLTPLATSSMGLLLTMGVLSAAGAAAGSFSILIGIAAQRLPQEKRSFAAGLINAGGSVGQSVFAPLVQLIIGAAGWASAMFATAFAALLTIPLVLPLRRSISAGSVAATSLVRSPTFRSASNCAWRCAIRVTCACTPDSSPAAFTSRFSSRICRTTCYCAVSGRKSQRAR